MDFTTRLWRHAIFLVKWVDEELRESGLPLNQNALVRVLTQWNGVTEDIDTNHIHVVHLSNRDLPDIQPLSKEKIDAFEHIYARHPIFFIFRGEIIKTKTGPIDYRRMNRMAISSIYKNDGSLLWWDPNIYTSVIAEGDVAIVFGEKSLKEAEFLVKQGSYPDQNNQG